MNRYFELSPRYDKRNSFYGKAHIIETTKNITLQSYDTKILTLNKYTHNIKFLTKNVNNFSQTTDRHINEFLLQYTNEGKKSRKEILKMAEVI